MDPLIAAQVYNAENTIAGRLPDELLIHILDLIGEDAVTLYCLRRVCRTFRRLVFEPRIWERTRSDPPMIFDDDEWSFNLPFDEYELLQKRLRTDGMCSDCKLWCDVPVEGRSRRRAQARNLSGRRCKVSLCKFRDSQFPLLHCRPCGTHQDPLQFSPSEQKPGKRGRTCLGRQGAVQLCEHIRISWPEIEHYFIGWLRYRPGDWDALFGGFKIECRDPSHDRRCADEGPHTWPRARIEADDDDENRLLLILEWIPHSGVDAIILTQEGQAPAPDLRRLFEGYRRGAGSIMFPSCALSPLPEMACYGIDECRCIYYETGAGETSSARVQTNGYEASRGRDVRFHARLFGEDSELRIPAVHRTRRGLSGFPHEVVSMTRHCPTGNRSEVCLVTTYRRRIRLFSKQHILEKVSPSSGARPGVAVEPSHAWFHAMDPDTYARPSAGLDLPLCKKGGCMNYYRRPKVTDCGNPGQGIHYPCDCS